MLLFSYDVANQRKIEGRTAFENNVLGEEIKNGPVFWNIYLNIFASLHCINLSSL